MVSGALGHRFNPWSGNSICHMPRGSQKENKTKQSHQERALLPGWVATKGLKQGTNAARMQGQRSLGQPVQGRSLAPEDDWSPASGKTPFHQVAQQGSRAGPREEGL